MRKHEEVERIQATPLAARYQSMYIGLAKMEMEAMERGIFKKAAEQSRYACIPVLSSYESRRKPLRGKHLLTVRPSTIVLDHRGYLVCQMCPAVSEF